jgi:hypothetical protein
MKDNASVLEAKLSYAVSLVRWSFFTPDQAARTCGVPLPTLRAALAETVVPRMPAPTLRPSSLNTGVPV